MQSKCIECVHVALDKRRISYVYIVAFVDPKFALRKKYDSVLDSTKNWKKLQEEKNWEICEIEEDEEGDAIFVTLYHGNLNSMLKLLKKI